MLSRAAKSPALSNIEPFLDAQPEFGSVKGSTSHKDPGAALASVQVLADDQNGGAHAANVETTGQRSLRFRAPWWSARAAPFSARARPRASRMSEAGSHRDQCAEHASPEADSAEEQSAHGRVQGVQKVLVKQVAR
jgi:hypothetical protein